MSHDIPQWMLIRSEGESLARFEPIPVRQCRASDMDRRHLYQPVE
jgi:hypothetical protein